MPVALTLCDRSPELVQAWRRYFPIESGVKIVNQNILTLDVNALAFPANAFGFTDGVSDWPRELRPLSPWSVAPSHGSPLRALQAGPVTDGPLARHAGALPRRG